MTNNASVSVPNSKWKLKPQECEGDFWFSGTHYTTKTVAQTLSPVELMQIFTDILKAAHKQQGLDYFQVFEHPDGRKIFVIDQLSRADIESGRFPANENYVTVMFAEEY